jgi:hypothetical protein
MGSNQISQRKFLASEWQTFREMLNQAICNYKYFKQDFGGIFCSEPQRLKS